MKPKAFGALIVCAVCVLDCSPGDAQNKGAQRVETQSKANQGHPTTFPLPLNQMATDGNQSQGRSVTKADQPLRVSVTTTSEVPIKTTKDPFDKALVWATGLLVAVGGFQIFFMWRAVAATRDAANAAKRTARLLVNAERAWILVHVENPRVDPRASQTSVAGELIYENKGKSPVWITERRIGLKVIRSLGDEPPVDSLALIDSPEPLAEGKPASVPFGPHAQGQWPSEGKMLLLYGIVRYRDIFGKSRATRFAYTITPSLTAERLASPHEYNSYT